MYFKLEFQVESTIHLPCQQRLHNVTLCNIYMCIGSRCIRSRSLGRSHNLIHGDKKEESLRICFVCFQFVNYLTLIACFTTFKNRVQKKVFIFFFFFIKCHVSKVLFYSYLSYSTDTWFGVALRMDTTMTRVQSRSNHTLKPR